MAVSVLTTALATPFPFPFVSSAFHMWITHILGGTSRKSSGRIIHFGDDALRCFGRFLCFKQRHRKGDRLWSKLRKGKISLVNATLWKVFDQGWYRIWDADFSERSC
jgi:hypothetical protein